MMQCINGCYIVSTSVYNSSVLYTLVFVSIRKKDSVAQNFKMSSNNYKYT